MRTATLELRGTPPTHGRTPADDAASSGSIDPLPRVMSSPPLSTNRWISPRPAQPIPPVMSSDSAAVPDSVSAASS